MPLTDFVRGFHFDGWTPEEAGMFSIALHTAIKCHWGQRRLSGEEYHEHVLAATALVQELGLDAPSCIAEVLHDVVEDCDMSVSQIRDIFGKKVAIIVWGLTKVPNNKRLTQKRLLRATSRHWETIFDKLADRLHNIQTVYGIPSPERQKLFLEETLGPLKKTALECRKYIPESELHKFDELLNTVIHRAEQRLLEIS